MQMQMQMRILRGEEFRQTLPFASILWEPAGMLFHYEFIKAYSPKSISVSISLQAFFSRFLSVLLGFFSGFSRVLPRFPFFRRCVSGVSYIGSSTETPTHLSI